MTKAVGANFLRRRATHHWRGSRYERPLRLPVMVLAFCSALFGRVSSGEGGSSEVSVIGDKDGGKIPNGVGSQQAAAFNSINQHCAQFGRKGFITKMDFDSGTLTFECRVQKPKPSI